MTTYTMDLGESKTFAFDVQGVADLTGFKVYIGSKSFDLVDKGNNLFWWQLSPNSAKHFGAHNKISAIIESPTVGVQKIDALFFLDCTPSAMPVNSDATTDIVSVTTIVSVTETAITVDAVVYDYAKGDTGSQGVKGDDGLTYIPTQAWASDANGTGWSLTPNDSLKYSAFIPWLSTNPTPPTSGDYVGALWQKVVGDNGEVLFADLYDVTKMDGSIVPQSTLYYHQSAMLSLTGTISATSGDYWKVSDFIPIGVGVKIQALNLRPDWGGMLCYAFYSSENESSFISGFSAPNTSAFNEAVNLYEGYPAIPDEANYIRIAINTTYLAGYCINQTFIKSVIEKPIITNTLQYFTVDLNVGKLDDESITSGVQFDYIETQDYCAIRLPNNYDPYGPPVPLIIYSHGAGSPVTASSCNISGTSNWADYLTQKGFAILDCNALPNALKKSWMHETQCAGFGSEYSINAVLAAYEYVCKTYNIARDKVFGLSTSMGGLTTGNLVNTGNIPIRAVWMDCPVTGLYESAWIHPWWSDHRMIYMAITYLYNFENWDEQAQTYTVLSGPYAGTHSFTVSYYIDKYKYDAYYEQEKAKTIGRNPWQNKRILTGNVDAFIYPCPLVISHGSTDTVNDINVNKSYLSKIKLLGQVANFREFPTSNHGLFGVGSIVADEDGIMSYPIPIEICRFFKKYL